MYRYQKFEDTLSTVILIVLTIISTAVIFGLIVTVIFDLLK